MRRLLPGFAFLASALLCSGCVKQVGYSALEMQESYKTLLYKQVLYNLQQAITAKADADTAKVATQNISFLPSQILIAAGSAQVTGSVTPTIGVPLPVSTITDTMANGAMAPYTHATATNLGNVSPSVQLSDSNQVSWTLTTQTDPDALRRLRALYLFAVGGLTADCPQGGPSHL